MRAYLGRGGEDSGAELCSEVWHEPPDRAVGDGCGVLLVAETDAGCLLGASGARTRSSELGLACELGAQSACPGPEATGMLKPDQSIA